MIKFFIVSTESSYFYSTTLAFSIFTSISGRSFLSVGSRSICSTISIPSNTCQNIVCLRSRKLASRAVTMKNCEPFVLRPALAIEITHFLCVRVLSVNSSSKARIHILFPPEPVPVGSHHWIMKSRITRWNIIPS